MFFFGFVKSCCFVTYLAKYQYLQKISSFSPNCLLFIMWTSWKYTCNRPNGIKTKFHHAQNKRILSKLKLYKKRINHLSKLKIRMIDTNGMQRTPKIYSIYLKWISRWNYSICLVFLAFSFYRSSIFLVLFPALALAPSRCHSLSLSHPLSHHPSHSQSISPKSKPITP